MFFGIINVIQVERIKCYRSVMNMAPLISPGPYSLSATSKTPQVVEIPAKQSWPQSEL